MVNGYKLCYNIHMNKHEALDRVVRILVDETNVAAEIISGQRQATVAGLAAALSTVKKPELIVPKDNLREIFEELGHVKLDSGADARSLVDAILRADNRRAQNE